MVGTASFITTISPYYQKKITELVQVPGHTIYNGFSELIEKKEKSNNDEFVITYNGTLYETQEIEIFLDGYKLFLDSKPNVNVKLKFPGILIDKTQAQRVANYLQGYEEFYEMTDRLPKEQVLEIQQNSDLLLMVAHKNIKGVTSSKIFEYLSLQKPFIVCPNDHDVLEEISSKSGLGVVLDSEQEIFQYLSRIERNEFQIDIKKIMEFEERTQITKFSNEIVKQVTF
jgi:glycosyltransferase involved in cell wall biosynthesis